MTPRQIELARHALGLTRPNVKRSYRNHFVAGPGHEDYEEWRGMVEEGMATQHKSRLSGDMFHLTIAGARAALSPGESLDLQDFS